MLYSAEQDVLEIWIYETCGTISMPEYELCSYFIVVELSVLGLAN